MTRYSDDVVFQRGFHRGRVYADKKIIGRVVEPTREQAVEKIDATIMQHKIKWEAND